MNPPLIEKLASRLRATTLFAHIPREALASLLQRSPLRHASAGSWLADTPAGLKAHLILLSGELEAVRSWIDADGCAQQSVWRVGLEPDGPGFALLSAASSGIRVQALAEVQCIAVDGAALDDLLDWSHLDSSKVLARHLKVFRQLPLENAELAFERMVERPVAAGETVVTQGEPGDAYYIILV